MILRASERAFVIVLLLLNMGVIDSLIRPQAAPAVVSTITTDIPPGVGTLVTVVYAWGGILVVARWRQMLRAARAVWPLLAFAALAPVSVLWSIDPLLTMRRSALVASSTVLSIYLGKRFSIEQLARMLLVAMSAMMMLVVAFRLFAPGIVLDETGALKGLSPHKNAFGAYVGIFLILIWLIRFKNFDALRYPLAGVAVILLLLSHSMAALVGSLMVVAATPLWRSVRRPAPYRALAAVVGLATIALALSIIQNTPDTFFKLVGRDPTFTGRTHLWSLVLPAITKHPLLGYGYGAFWWTGSGEALRIWIASRWMPTAADNGYLDLTLDTGLFAIPFLLWVVFRYFRTALMYIRFERHPLAVWPAAYLSFFLLDNVFESQLLTTRSFAFLFFAAIMTCLSVNFRSSTAFLTGTGAAPAIIAPHRCQCMM